MKVRTRHYWTLANYHGDLWEFDGNVTYIGTHSKLWRRKSDVPKKLRSDIRVVRVRVVETPKRRRVKRPIDKLIAGYVGGRYRFRKAKEAVLKKVRGPSTALTQ